MLFFGMEKLRAQGNGGENPDNPPRADSCFADFDYEFFFENSITVKFYNRSVGEQLITVWDFGDGERDFLRKNPSKMYLIPGVYTVCLYIFNNSNGCFDVTCKDIAVQVEEDDSRCEAKFSFFNNNRTVSFTNKSVPTGAFKIWTLGDGSYSIQNNPEHTYSEDLDSVKVCLEITDSLCRDTFCRDINLTKPSNGCFSNFQFTRDGLGTGVFFKNKSLGENQVYAWNFGDGSRSREKNPFHRYEKVGSYYACLAITDTVSQCYDVFCQTIVVDSVQSPCAINYDYCVQDSLVSFFEKEATDFTSFNWDFGDGHSDSIRNPTHLFDSIGNYTICVEASNETCIDSTCFEVEVNSTNSCCNSDFEFIADTNSDEVYFYTPSNKNDKDFRWDFGDGNISIEKNPVHSYVDTGRFKICLTVISDEGPDCEASTCKPIYVTEEEVKKDLDRIDKSFSGTLTTLVKPNPTSGSAVFEIQKFKGGSFDVMVFDYTGKLISQINNIESSIFNLDFSKFSAGIYTFMLIDERGLLSSGKVIYAKK
jgi:PKD repeat protein